MRHPTILFGVWLTCVTAGSMAAENYPRGELLIEAADLAAQPPNRLSVLDARTRAAYNARHIAGAQWIDHEAWAKAFGEGNDVASWTKRLADLGIDNASSVVIYDDGVTRDAARVWWILRFWGLPDVRLLNGGWKSWQAASLPVDQAVPATPVASQPKLSPLSERLANKDKLLASLTGGTLQIIDARSEGEFCGTDPRRNQRAGAIPGAIHLEWSDLLDPSTQRFKPAAELDKLFRAAGVDLQRPSATHCQSGGRSSVMAFGMELMGAKDVSNYYRSWEEWGNLPDTPIVPGKPRPGEQGK